MPVIDTPHTPTPPRKRRTGRIILITLVALVVLCGGGIALVAALSKGGTTVVADSPAAKSQPPQVKAWGAGTYKVGEDITAGSYKTTGTEFGCYWERLKGDSGEFDDIIANDNIDNSAPARMTIKGTDRFVKFSGDCKWIKA